MNMQLTAVARARRPAGDDPRAELLAGVPVTERRLLLAGISTAVLEGGDGPPLVLLHGPGESAVNWRWVIPELVKTHRVVAPDLPAHGGSAVGDGSLGAGRVLDWLGELIENSCSASPVMVGHILGGAVAARYALEDGDRLDRLVLVDSLGLAPFRPSPRFALAMIHFMVRPGEQTYERFMRQCAYDLDNLRQRMGEDWEPFAAYNLALARKPEAKHAGRLLREVGLPRIPPEDLARITVPTTLIWGRQDRANRLGIAEAASARYGWPLHVIDDCADDPPRDRPEAFLRALRQALDAVPAEESAS